MNIEKIRQFVVNHTAQQLNAPPSSITDETLIPDPYGLIQVGAVILCKSAKGNMHNLTVGNAIKLFSN